MTLGEQLFAECEKNYEETYYPNGRGKGDITFEQEFIGEPHGCFAEGSNWEYWDEVTDGIWDKFYALYGPLRDHLMDELQMEWPIPTIVIDTSYDDATRVAITYKGVVLAEDSVKSWYLYWNSREEMCKFLENTYKKMRAMAKLADDINVEELAKEYMKEEIK